MTQLPALRFPTNAMLDISGLSRGLSDIADNKRRLASEERARREREGVRSYQRERDALQRQDAIDRERRGYQHDFDVLDRRAAQAARISAQKRAREDAARERIFKALGINDALDDPEPASSPSIPDQVGGPRLSTNIEDRTVAAGPSVDKQESTGLSGINREAALRVLALGGSTEDARKAALTPDDTKKDDAARQYAIQNLDRLADSVTKLINHPGKPTLTGAIDNWRPDIDGWNTADARAILDEIGSKTSIAALSEMRQASKTGGALGNVTEKELALLERSIASLSTTQSDEQFARQLDYILQQVQESRAKIDGGEMSDFKIERID